MPLSAPARLDDSHDLSRFDCGVAPLDDWLKRRARHNAAQGASHTYIVADADVVVGYYALAAGSVTATSTPGRFRRNMPDPIPVVVLGRLAIDRTWQGRGIGRALFRDAAFRVMQAADIIGVRGMLVHAISEEARDFYLAIGLIESPLSRMTLMATLADLRAGMMRPP